MAGEDRKVAVVTGASRGIGKACAQYLAKAGYDVAILARTVNEGEGREHSSTVKKSDNSSLPGSLSSTADLIRAEGREVMTLPADLLDRGSLGAAAATVLERWGHVDVLLNNGRYVGPGHMDRFLDTPLELLDKHLEANVMAPLVLIKQILPAMVARGSGVIANLTSGSGQMDPEKAAGEGGWGLGYGFSKASIHRVAGILHVENFKDGVIAVNVDPGYVVTERIIQDMAPFGFTAEGGAPPAAVGAAFAWLVSSGEATNWAGKVFSAQQVCHEKGLLPGWAGPATH
jgi:NAD(P)-dependent dehydrogenase (short-subunit alcohol dehydrogenase family)